MKLMDMADGPDKSIIIDLTGLGLSDLKNKILRTPVNPEETFDEDPSRMLRAIRMIVKYGLKFDPPVAKAIRNKASEIQRVPEELIKQELEKIIKLKGFKTSIMLLKGLGLLRYVFPEINDLKGLKTAIDVANGVDPDVVNRLAALFSVMDLQTAKILFKEQVEFWEDTQLDAETIGSILRRVKFPNDIVKRVVKILNNTNKLVGTPELSDKEIRRLIITFGDSLEATLEIVNSINLNGAIEYVNSINKNYIPELKERLKAMSEGEGEVMLQRIKNPPFDGNAIMSLLGLDRGGPIVKRALDIQLEILLENPFADKELIEKTIVETLAR
jgi:poly(A) polymerase